MAPLPPKKPSKSIISSSIQASSAAPGDPASSSPAWASDQSPGHATLAPNYSGVGHASKRNETLALLTEAKLVETLMYLHLPPVVGRLLANQVLEITLHAL